MITTQNAFTKSARMYDTVSKSNSMELSTLSCYVRFETRPITPLRIAIDSVRDALSKYLFIVFNIHITLLLYCCWARD